MVISKIGNQTVLMESAAVLLTALCDIIAVIIFGITPTLTILVHISRNVILIEILASSSVAPL